MIAMSSSKRCNPGDEYLYTATGGTRSKPFGRIGTFLTRGEAQEAARRSGRPGAHVERYCTRKFLVDEMRRGHSYEAAIHRLAGRAA